MNARQLLPFCCDWREPLSKPFSRGEYTYASDGHIAVRIARDDETPDEPRAPAIETIMARHDFDAIEYTPAPALALPPVSFTDCDECSASGYEHDCPDCSCRCQECNGKGRFNDDAKRSIGLSGRALSMETARLVWSLPGLELGPAPDLGSYKAWPFRFAGGVGVFMCRNRPAKFHTDHRASGDGGASGAGCEFEGSPGATGAPPLQSGKETA